MLDEQEQSGVDYLEATLAPAQVGDVLELDELWSFVASKKNPVWLWVALCRRTRQIVAWHYGERDEHTCAMLWLKVPEAYKQGLLYSDFWKAYQAVLPVEQHRPCAKGDGETNHVERFFLTLRQRVGRFTRRTLSFSKCPFLHLVHIRHFLVAYNHYCLHRFLTPT